MGVEVLEDLERHREALDVAAAAGRVEAPWLIVHGEEDETVPVAEARDLYAAATAHERSAEVERETVPGAGHTFGAVHPFAGPTPQLTRALNATQTWLLGHLGTRASDLGDAPTRRFLRARTPRSRPGRRGFRPPGRHRPAQPLGRGPTGRHAQHRDAVGPGALDVAGAVAHDQRLRRPEPPSQEGRGPLERHRRQLVALDPSSPKAPKRKNRSRPKRESLISAPRRQLPVSTPRAMSLRRWRAPRRSSTPGRTSMPARSSRRSRDSR